MYLKYLDIYFCFLLILFGQFRQAKKTKTKKRRFLIKHKKIIGEYHELVKN